MKIIIATLACLIGFSSYSQEITFTPNWKKGSGKKLVIKSETKKSKKEGKWEIESNEFEANLIIKDVKKDHYIIQLTYDDFFLKSFKDAFDRIGENTKNQKKLNLIFKVTKDGKDFELINWKDAKDLMNGTFNDISAAVNNLSDKDSIDEVLFNPFSMLFTQEMVQSMFSNEMEAFLAPYKFSWSRDTVKQSQTEINPFGKGKNDSLTVQTISWIENKEIDIFHLASQDIFDMEKFEEMMKTVMKTMLSGFMKLAPDTTSDKFIQKKNDLNKLLNNMSFNVDKRRSVTFDKKRGFVKTYRSDSNMDGSIMGRPITSISWSEVTFR
jgi:hypothetical protein